LAQELGGKMYIQIQGLLLVDGKLFIVADNGDVVPVPPPPRLTLALEPIKENGDSNPFFDVSRAQIVCESASATLALRRMLFQLLQPEVSGKIIPFPQSPELPQERKLKVVV
jgi:hypothetical protein